MADSTVANTSKEQKVVNLSQLGVPQLEQIKTQLEEVRGAHILTRINRISTVHLAYTGTSIYVLLKVYELVYVRCTMDIR